MERDSGPGGQTDFDLWEEHRQSRAHEPQYKQQGGVGEFPTGSQPPTEALFANHDEREEHFGLHPHHYHSHEHSAPASEEQQARHWTVEGAGHDEFEHEVYKHGAEAEDWRRYGDEHNSQDGHDLHVPPGHQFQYNVKEEYDRNKERETFLRSDEATISSLRKNAVTAIPGLGGGFEDQKEKDLPKSVWPSDGAPEANQSHASGGSGGGGDGEGKEEVNVGGNQANHMIQSLGKIVSQLQTLKGITSSLQLLHTLPKESKEEVRKADVISPKERSETELSEETKRKVAALLATESDSDGEQVNNNINVVKRGGWA